jgi:hypothetical protein
MNAATARCRAAVSPIAAAIIAAAAWMPDSV